MADSFIQLPADSTGKSLDTEQLLVGANTVHRERMQIAGSAATEIASVSTAGALLVEVVELPTAAALADAAANPTTTSMAAHLMGFNGTTWDRVHTKSDGDSVAAATTGFLALGSDGSNYLQLLTSATGALQVDVLSGAGSGTTDTDDDSVATGQTGALSIGLTYGYNGATWERVTTDGSGALDVNVTVALPTGSNTIGNIGTVTTSVTPGTAAAHLGKAVDAASAVGDTGVAALVVRDDVPGFTTEVDGDYVALRVDSSGRLHVTDPGAGGGTTDTDDDSVATGQVASLGINLGYGYNGATWERLTTDGSGALDVTLTAALPAGANSIGDLGTVTTVTTVGAVTAITNALPVGANVIGDIANIGTSVTPGTAAGNLGKAVDAVAGGSDTGVASLVKRVTTPSTITPANGDYTTLSVDDDGRLHVTDPNTGVAAGDVAHDAVDSGNPLKVGAKAIAHGTNPTAVAADDRTDLYASRAGIPFVIGGHPNIITREITVLDSDGAQTNAAAITISAGSKIVVTRVSVMADKLNTVDVACRIGFGTAAVPTASLAGVNGVVFSHPNIAAGSGAVEGNGSGILGIGADDEDLRYDCDDPVTGSLKIVISYYTVES